jgi:hypothetical protein
MSGLQADVFCPDREATVRPQQDVSDAKKLASRHSQFTACRTELFVSSHGLLNGLLDSHRTDVEYVPRLGVTDYGGVSQALNQVSPDLKFGRGYEG